MTGEKVGRQSRCIRVRVLSLEAAQDLDKLKGTGRDDLEDVEFGDISWRCTKLGGHQYRQVF